LPAWLILLSNEIRGDPFIEKNVQGRLQLNDVVAAVEILLSSYQNQLKALFLKIEVIKS
jgi:hypothetical protein